MGKFYNEFDFQITDSAFEKCSAVIDIDGVKFRVNYLPKAQLKNIFLMLDYLTDDSKHASRLEDYLEQKDAGFSGLLKWIPQEEVIEEYVNFVKVCLLARDKEVMETLLKSAPRKRDGTLSGKKVQRIAWSGCAIEDQYHEIRTVNDSSNVMKIEIRRQNVHHKTVKDYETVPTFTEFINRYPDADDRIGQYIQKLIIERNDDEGELTKEWDKCDCIRVLFKYDEEYDQALAFESKYAIAIPDGLGMLQNANLSGLKNLIQTNGGTIESELSEETDYLLVYEDSLGQSDIQEMVRRASDLSIPVLDIGEFGRRYVKTLKESENEN